MFKAIVSAETLKDALDSVSVLVDECKIRLNEEEFAIRAVDPANVGMVDLSLAAAAFESYEADGGVIGVNLGRLEDIAGMANSGDLIHLELDEETRKLHIQIDGLATTSPSALTPPTRPSTSRPRATPTTWISNSTATT